MSPRPTAWDVILGPDEPLTVQQTEDRYPVNTLPTNHPDVLARVDAVHAPIHLAWSHGQHHLGKALGKRNLVGEYNDHIQQILDVVVTYSSRTPFIGASDPTAPYRIRLQQIEMVIDAEPNLLIWSLIGWRGYFREGPWWDYLATEAVPNMMQLARNHAEGYARREAQRVAEEKAARAAAKNKEADAWLNRRKTR